MFDKMAISKRFFDYHRDLTRGEIAQIYKVSSTFVTEWATKGVVPWSRLKYLSDSRAISWDWLLDGIEPRASVKDARTPRSTKPKFPIAAINGRFFSLFPDTAQNEIANRLDASVSIVNDWKKNRTGVPWHRLAWAVAAYNLRWDWLIDGLDPKYR